MSIDNLVQILNNRDDMNGWKIKETKQEAYELYYIKRELEMNRAKNIHKIALTVYKDFTEDGIQYKGSSTTQIHPTMTEEEVQQAIDEAVYASQFAKVQYYPLVQPSEEKHDSISSNLKEKPLHEYLPLIVEAIFKNDNYDNGSINSTEIFLRKVKTHIINSLGIDYEEVNYDGEIEFITNWKEDKEEIELYKHIDFGDFNSEHLSNEVNEMLIISQARAIAENTKNLGQHKVILNGESVKQMMEYYLYQLSTGYIYEKYSDVKLDSSIQGNNVIGDKISMRLKPFLKGSTNKACFDDDGIILKEINIIEDGIAKNYWGGQRYSYYLGMEPTGNIKNFEVSLGKDSIEASKQEAYLEILSFSSFQLDDFTGDFGGEIRLAWYFDGKKRIPVTGGSISGNINEKHHDMKLSKEDITINNYHGPKYLILNDVVVSGI